MTKTTVFLQAINDVKEFVTIVMHYDFDIDLVSGRYAVDAKSIMGIFSLDLSKPIQLNAHTDDAEKFLKEIDKSVIEKQEPERKAAAGMPAEKRSTGGDTYFKYREKPASDKLPDFAAGDRVKSFVHGEGTVLSVSPMAGDVLLEIAFDQAGTKKILAKYARIRKVSS